MGKTNAVTVDLMTSYLVTGVATQGRAVAAEWVTEYSVDTSNCGLCWINRGNFVGNIDQQSICKAIFKKPVLARFVKFTVLKYHGYPSIL